MDQVGSSPFTILIKIKMNKCESCSRPAEIMCGCSSIKLCSKCIGAHLINDPSFYHKPQVLHPSRGQPQAPEKLSAICDRLKKELALLQDFQEISLQFVNAVVQNIEKQLHAAADDLRKKIQSSCGKALSQLSASIESLQGPTPDKND